MIKEPKRTYAQLQHDLRYVQRNYELQIAQTNAMQQVAEGIVSAIAINDLRERVAANSKDERDHVMQKYAPLLEGGKSKQRP